MTKQELFTLHIAIHAMDADLDALFTKAGHSHAFEDTLQHQEEMIAALLQLR